MLNWNWRREDCTEQEYKN